MPGAVETTTDTSHGMVRTEVIAPAAAAIWAMSSLTGPSPPACAYCINGAALDFKPDERSESIAKRKTPRPVSGAAAFFTKV